MLCFSSLLSATSLLLQRRGSRLPSFTRQIFPIETSPFTMTPWKLVKRTKPFNQVGSLFLSLINNYIGFFFYCDAHISEYFALTFPAVSNALSLQRTWIIRLRRQGKECHPKVILIHSRVHRRYIYGFYLLRFYTKIHQASQKCCASHGFPT